MKHRLVKWCVLLAPIGYPMNVVAQSTFENYATFEAVADNVTSIRFQSAYAEAPFDWFTSSGAPKLPGYDASVTSAFDITVTSLPMIDPIKMVLTLSADFEQTLQTHAPDGTVTGTITLSGSGEEAFDLNPATIDIDPAAGIITRRFGSPFLGGHPVIEANVTETTGIFADIQAVGPWQLFVSAQQDIPIVEGLDLIDNLAVTPLATIGQAVTVGQFVPEPSGFLLTAVGVAIIVLVGHCRRTLAVFSLAPANRWSRY